MGSRPQHGHRFPERLPGLTPQQPWTRFQPLRILVHSCDRRVGRGCPGTRRRVAWTGLMAHGVECLPVDLLVPRPSSAETFIQKGKGTWSRRPRAPPPPPGPRRPPGPPPAPALARAGGTYSEPPLRMSTLQPSPLRPSEREHVGDAACAVQEGVASEEPGHRHLPLCSNRGAGRGPSCPRLGCQEPQPGRRLWGHLSQPPTAGDQVSVSAMNY